MDVGSFFVAYAKSAEFEQPTKGPFDDTTMNAQPTAMIRVSLGDERLDAALAQRHADFFFGVVGAIGERRVRPLAATTARTFDRRNRVDQRDRGLRIVDVGGGVRDGQRRPLAIAGNMPLRAIFAAIRGIGAGVRPQKALAPSNCRWLPSTSRSRRPSPVRRAAHARFFPTRRPPANRASDASKSCPSRIPVPWAGTPKDNRCAAQTRFPSVPADWKLAADHPSAWHDPAADTDGNLVCAAHGFLGSTCPRNWDMVPGMTCWRRLRDWQVAGVWEKIWRVLLDELGLADDSAGRRWPSTVARCGRVLGAHTGPIPPIAAKIARSGMLPCDGQGTPLAITHTAANVHDSQAAIPLIDAIPPIKRPGGGRRKQPDPPIALRFRRKNPRHRAASNPSSPSETRSMAVGWVSIVVSSNGLSVDTPFRAPRTLRKTNRHSHSLLTIGCLLIC